MIDIGEAQWLQLHVELACESAIRQNLVERDQIAYLVMRDFGSFASMLIVCKLGSLILSQLLNTPSEHT